jgi:hypothetical protein
VYDEYLQPCKLASHGEDQLLLLITFLDQLPSRCSGRCSPRPPPSVRRWPANSSTEALPGV